MKILSIDNSITSPGFIKADIDENFNVSNLKTLTFTTSKRFESQGDVEVHYYHKNYFNHQFDKIRYINEQWIRWLGDDQYDYVFIEDYSFASTGQVFSLAESTGFLKYYCYEHNIKIRLYSVPSIKKFFSGKGNADKVKMEMAFEQNNNKFKPDLKFLPSVVDKKSGNPIDNIIDAYAIFCMGLYELKLRNNLIKLEAQDKYIQEVFSKPKKKKNRKKQSESYIEKEFISKK